LGDPECGSETAARTLKVFSEMVLEEIADALAVMPAGRLPKDWG